MNFEKNEFVFGIHEIFAIFLKRIKLIICFIVFALSFNVSVCLLKDKAVYFDDVMMYTSYSFTNNEGSNENFEAEVNYYILQIRNLTNSLINDENYYNNLINRIKINKTNEQLTFTVPSYKTLKKSLNFVYDEATAFSFQIKYNSLNKNECYAVIKSAIEETIKYAPTIDEKLSVRYSTSNEQYNIDNVFCEKPGFRISKIALVILAFGFVLAFALELFSKKVKYTYVVENIVHPNYMITMDKFENEGDK